MKRKVLTILFAVFVLAVGAVAADPGPHNPHVDQIVDVDCEGSDHDYDLLYTVGLSPWFDPQGTTVSPGPARVEMAIDGEWVLLFALPDQGIPTTFCSWTRGSNFFRGDVQFAPPR